MKPQQHVHQIKNIALSVVVMSATIIAQGARSIASPATSVGAMSATTTLAQSQVDPTRPANPSPASAPNQDSAPTPNNPTNIPNPSDRTTPSNRDNTTTPSNSNSPTNSPSNPNAPSQTRPANPGDITAPNNTNPNNSPNTSPTTTPSNSTPGSTTPSIPTTPSGTTPTTPGTSPSGQINAPNADYAGNWAEPFIRTLIERNIIVGYPDGTYRPDQPITRAEFAALLNKAFDLQPTRASRTFTDVPSNYWGAAAIDRAYRAGFLAGYPNGTFAPNQNIIRIESLVALTNGSGLRPNNTADRTSELFSDAAQVPSYGRDALLAATQRCVAVSVSYPTTRGYDPNRVATRADVAASLHQVLVAAGRIPALPGNSTAQQYIVNCNTNTASGQVTEQDILNRTSIGTAPGIVAATGRRGSNAPATGVTTPSAFGADLGDIFVAAGYQNTIPTTFLPGGGDRTVYGAGLGLGNARDFIGLEASYSAYGASFADRSAVNFKVHKQFGDNFAVAGGWENAIRFGGFNATNDPGQTFYGVATGILPLGETSNITASVGAGNGRFRSFGDLTANNDTTNIFGSLGLRFTENLAVAVDYNGRTYSAALPITFKLGDTVGFQVTPAWLDFAGDSAAGSSRFGIGGGLGFSF